MKIIGSYSQPYVRKGLAYEIDPTAPGAGGTSSLRFA
jgi:hypothetical protein